MKKVLALLLVISFSAAFAAAEGLTFGAWTRVIWTAAMANINDAGAVPSTVANQGIKQGIGPDWGTNGPYVSFSANYQGPVFGFHGQWDGGTDGLMKSCVNFNLSVNLIADMLTMSVGQIRDDRYRLYNDTTPYTNGDMDWKIGRFDTGRTNLSGGAVGAMELTFAPKDTGLSITVMLPAGKTNSAVGGSKLENGATPLAINGILGNFFAAASFAIPSVGKITAGTTPKEGSGNGYGNNFAWSPEYDTTRAIFLGFQLTAVEGLNVLLAGEYDLNATPTVAGVSQDNILGHAAVSFSFDGFSIGVSEFLNVSLAPTNPIMDSITDLDVSYNLGVVSIGAGGSFSIVTNDASRSYTGFMIYPYVKINPISTQVAFEYQSRTNGQSFWKVPVTFDFGF